MSLYRINVLGWLLGFFLFPLQAQEEEPVLFQVMSYNVENCFDTADNPDVADEEFLPSGERCWTEGRYYRKLQHIAQVIQSAGGWNTPALVGLCEVENDSVMHHLLTRTSLRQLDYRYCITHGQDRRGINVALLYQRDQFRWLGSEEIEITLPQKERPTRNILHVWGEIQTSDTVDVFVCHMPSRSGGEIASRPKRLLAANRLRACVDSVLSMRTTPQCLIMGDFNDMPEDESLSVQLRAQAFPMDEFVSDQLYNLFYFGKGSYKYKGEWNQLDHFIVNGLLLDKKHSMHLQENGNIIYKPGFLLTEDKTGRGMRPFRTYYGFKYEGGYSDHLPLLCTFVLQSR